MSDHCEMPTLVKRALESLDAFRAQTLSVADLAQDLEATANAMEGDVPRELRNALRDAGGYLEVESFTSRGQECIDHAELIVQSIETALRSRYSR